MHKFLGVLVVLMMTLTGCAATAPSLDQAIDVVVSPSEEPTVLPDPASCSKVVDSVARMLERNELSAMTEEIGLESISLEITGAPVCQQRGGNTVVQLAINAKIKAYFEELKTTGCLDAFYVIDFTCSDDECLNPGGYLVGAQVMSFEKC